MYQRLAGGAVIACASAKNYEFEHLGGTCWTLIETLTGFKLMPSDNFTLPNKMYGDTSLRCKRILNTFQDRPVNTGVLLSGNKGSGKTLLAKTVSVEAAKLGIPTIMISSPFGGEGFNAFINEIREPAVILIDEFEKVYPTKFSSSDEDDGAGAQTGLLTLMDGTIGGKKLFMLTCNDFHGVSSFMRGRPGRIFYSYSYGNLEDKFVKEYSEDNLENKDHAELMVVVAEMYGGLNFDVMKAIVEDCNRYGESPLEVCKHVSISRDNCVGPGTYEFNVFWKNPKKKINLYIAHKNQYLSEFDESTSVNLSMDEEQIRQLEDGKTRSEPAKPTSAKAKKKAAYTNDYFSSFEYDVKEKAWRGESNTYYPGKLVCYVRRKRDQVDDGRFNFNRFIDV